MSGSHRFKCTACRILFETTADLKLHHKSDWHRYNLKRSLAEMHPIPFEAFKAKVEQLSSGVPKTLKGEAHLKRQAATRAKAASSERAAASKTPSAPSYPGAGRSLFDQREFQTVDENIAYMYEKYSFFLRDPRYLKDKVGLIQYLGAKVFEGHQCLYCNRPFGSLAAVRHHMISKGHTVIGTRTEEQEEELEDFYDYSESYKELLPAKMERQGLPEEDREKTLTQSLRNGNWATCWWLVWSMTRCFSGLRRAQINDYGNLIMPSGREAAHRSIAYVYKQRLPRRGGRTNVALALQNARQQQLVLTRGSGVRDVARESKKQLARWNQAAQRRDLATGIKANRLSRKIKRAEKYFI